MQIFGFLWLVAFLVIIVLNIVQLVRNGNSPVLTLSATVIDMKQVFRRHSRSYYVTFAVNEGSELKFCVKKSEYEWLSIGDQGALTHQGARYMGFIC